MHPVLFQFGSFTVHAYGTLVLLAVFVAVGSAYVAAARLKLAERAVIAAGIAMLFGLIVGARYGGIFDARGGGASAILSAGLSLAPGVIFGSLLVIPITLAFRAPLATMFDVLTPALLVGLGIGRVGCFLAGCCYGRPSDLPWAMHFPMLPAEFAGHGAQPLQLYLALAWLLSAAALFGALGRAKFQGQVALLGVSAFCVTSLSARLFRYEPQPLTLAPTIAWLVVLVVALVLAFSPPLPRGLRIHHILKDE
ncbi:MAG: prolipoprotein diacylglyceryl transferase [Archangium sp.]